ncbi:MAG: SusC/RagA family TonB-linked outer membrane protein [Mucilaginibacter sp.]|uniref:SusC/RagA family TonB-linked outer membrane protein n=1 Tax=Mucilaginibacter sp. TaxID=1882438 RepID=UPI0031A819C4
MKQKLLKIFMICLCMVTTAYAQNRTVTGTVTAKEDGLPMPGVTVKIKGTQVGTQTNTNGKYSLSVPAGSTLVFSFIVYAPQEVVVGDRKEINVVLVQSNQQLNEVVVTALGVKKSERSIGYSVSTVKGDDLVKSGESNIVEGLAAKATGVSVVSSSGTPGASSKVILRGPATFQGDNQPLIVVDGVPINNDVNYVNAGDNPYDNRLAGAQLSNRAIDINPDDIESVSILKGPAAAALYGQSAGNGAIIYTTKRGKSKNGIGVTFNSSAQFDKVSKLPKLQNRYGQGSGGVFSSGTANSFGQDLIANKIPTFDNVGNFFKTGSTLTNNVAINGGNDKTTFRMAVGSSNIKGIIPSSFLNRYNVRLTADSKLNDYITVGGTMNYTNTNSESPSGGSDLSGVMLALLRMPVEFDGRNYINKDGTQNTYFGSYDNPFFSARYNPFTEENNRLVGNGYVDAKLSKIFTLSFKVGVDSYHTSDEKDYAVSSVGNDAADGTGQVNRINVDFRSLYSDLLLKFNKSFGANKYFTLSGLVGANYNYSQSTSSFERGRVLSIPNFYNFSNAAELYVSNDASYQNSKAVLADVTLDYRSQIFLTLTGRNEWSTTFGPDSKGFFYPKADISYVFSSLLKDQKTISYGKIRFAYSNVGISPGVYRTKTYFTVPTIADGFTNGLSFPYPDADGVNHNGYAISATVPSEFLKPERNQGLEAGLEMKFFDNRLGFDATLYQQTSHDLLISQPVAPTSGFQYFFHNIAQIRNRGIEIGVTGTPVKTENFRWDVTANWSKNNNVVQKLAPGVTEFAVGNFFSQPQSFAIVGKPFGALYGYAFQRDSKGSVLISPDTGLPLIATEQSQLGNPNPTWLGNITNEFTYKAFSFSFLWDFRKGGTLWNGTWQNLNFRGKSIESEDRNRTYVIPGVVASGPNAGQPNTKEISGTSYITNYLGGGGQTNELSMQSGSWIRLRSVNFAYRLNLAKNNPKTPVQYVEFGLALRNIFLSTPYKGVDPETGLTGASANATGYDYYNNPGTKSGSVSVKVGF